MDGHRTRILRCLAKACNQVQRLVRCVLNFPIYFFVSLPSSCCSSCCFLHPWNSVVVSLNVWKCCKDEYHTLSEKVPLLPPFCVFLEEMPYIREAPSTYFQAGNCCRVFARQQKASEQNKKLSNNMCQTVNKLKQHRTHDYYCRNVIRSIYLL